MVLIGLKDSYATFDHTNENAQQTIAIKTYRYVRILSFDIALFKATKVNNSRTIYMSLIKINNYQFSLSNLLS